MTFTEAAAEVLRLAGKPLHYKEITELAIEKNLLSHVGKSPEITMGARLAALLKKEDKTNPIVRVKPGVFALREWEKKGRRSSRSAPVDPEAQLELQGTAVEGQDDDASETDDDGTDLSVEVNALEVEAATRVAAAASAKTEDDDDDQPVLSGGDQIRADLAASGAELFDDEDDDDQPILSAASNAGAAGPAGPDSGPDGGRRRRRRRRRGRGGDREPGAAGAAGTATDGGRMPMDRPSGGRLEANHVRPHADARDDAEGGDAPREGAAPARPQVRDCQQIMAGGTPTGIEVPLAEGDELAGRDSADAAVVVLGSFDRNAGPVPMRSVVDALARRGRLGGDPAASHVQLAASLRADNLRRVANSQRPRFRLASGARVALTEWTLGGELTRLEQDVIAAVERYREASRRALLRRIQELPGHAFIELALLALERAGLAQLRGIRRPGSPGGEAHFSAVHRTGTDEIRTAVVIRKDGRELGRERVSDLRGALHHYGSATAGWLLTTGQVLSGAREEASALNASPVALFDGLGFCKLLEDHEVGVVRTRFPVSIPDLELLDTLRG